MADTRRIVIELNAYGENEFGGGTGQTKSDGSSDLQKMLHPIKSIENQILGKSIFVNQAYQQAKGIIKNVATYQIYRNFTLKEDYLGEQDFKNTMTSINKAISFGSAVVSGAVVGSMAGLPAVGALIGATGYLINETVNYGKRMDSANLSLNSSVIQTNFGRTRAGLIDGGKGTQN